LIILFYLILQITPNDLPEHLQKLYTNFVNDYRRDIERYHIQHASQYMDEYRLKNFDWNLRVKIKFFNKINIFFFCQDCST
jgi:hypothetical protein